MLLTSLNWMSVEAYLEREDRVILITGAVEQHAYASLASDVLVPLEIAKAACRRDPVLIMPPLPYGLSPYFVAYPGTVSLRSETYAAVVREVLSGLLAQGFRRILVVNGHGGNVGVLVAVLTELGNAHPGARLRLFLWWRHPRVAAVAQAAGLPQAHANWSENFPGLTRVGPSPEGEKAAPQIPAGASAAETRALLGDGSYGGPYVAPDEIMAQFFDAAVDALVEALDDLKHA
ncbi:MAG: creatininase family protein [Anaerolineae bacterium]|nr:creatininase family protein [Anaerolineae bacterium]